MLYLLSQLTLALVLAGIAGGALGWLLHRGRMGNDMHQLREAISRLQRKLAQSEGDMALLSSDYQELEERARSERQRLQAENRELPTLRENLERSQLLVRQMMQQHESRVAELQNEILGLQSRLRELSASDRARVDRRAEKSGDAVPEGQQLRTTVSCDETVSQRRGWASMPVPDVLPGCTGPNHPPPADSVESDQSAHAASEAGSNSAEHTSFDLPDTLFDKVDQVDDLQQIMGIDTVTERALNRLGITSYSQLAELERHDIERIAEALNIGPTRIEHDDWVGSARRQLEDVLEEL